MVHAIANQAVSDGSYPIRDILDKGYEDSFYVVDLMGLNEEPETIIRTLMIETTTDWDQLFEDHGLGFSIQEFLKGIDVAEDLASDFDNSLLRQCMDLVEEKGKDRPDSGFVDIFGQKVFQVF